MIDNVVQTKDGRQVRILTFKGTGLKHESGGTPIVGYIIEGHDDESHFKIHTWDMYGNRHHFFGKQLIRDYCSRFDSPLIMCPKEVKKEGYQVILRHKETGTITPKWFENKCDVIECANDIESCPEYDLLYQRGLNGAAAKWVSQDLTYLEYPKWDYEYLKTLG